MNEMTKGYSPNLSASAGRCKVEQCFFFHCKKEAMKIVNFTFSFYTIFYFHFKAESKMSIAEFLESDSPKIEFQSNLM